MTRAERSTHRPTGLTARERKYVARRARRARLWPWAAGVLLALVVVFGVWLWFVVPLLINPWVTIEGLESQTVSDTTLTLMAVLTPILMLACLVLLVAMILLTLAAYANERRHLAVIERELSKPETDEAAGSPQ